MDETNREGRKRTGVMALLAALWGGRSRRGFSHYMLLGVMSLGIVATVLLAFWYLQTRQPISEAPVIGRLPGVSAAPAAPPFLFAIYGLDAPIGVAVSPDGSRVYATDRDGERVVHVYDRAGEETGKLAPTATEQVEWDPLYLALGPDGSLYVSDLHYGAVHQFGPDGAYRGTLRPAGLDGERWFPVALAADAGGTLYLTEVTPGRHRVLVVDAAGELKAESGSEGAGQGELSFPNGLVVDGSGQVYVGDSNNSRVQILDQGTGALSVADSMRGLSMPRGMAVVGDRLYLADTVGQTVLVYALEGERAPRLLYNIGEEGLADGQFRYPEAVAVDATGRVYVADRVNNRIQVFGNQ